MKRREGPGPGCEAVIAQAHQRDGEKQGGGQWAGSGLVAGLSVAGSGQDAREGARRRTVPGCARVCQVVLSAGSWQWSRANVQTERQLADAFEQIITQGAQETGCTLEI